MTLSVNKTCQRYTLQMLLLVNTLACFTGKHPSHMLVARRTLRKSNEYFRHLHKKQKTSHCEVSTRNSPTDCVTRTVRPYLHNFLSISQRACGPQRPCAAYYWSLRITPTKRTAKCEFPICSLLERCQGWGMIPDSVPNSENVAESNRSTKDSQRSNGIPRTNTPDPAGE